MGERTELSATDHLATVARLAAGRIRSDWQYRTSFLVFLLSQAVTSGLELAAILIVVDIAPSLGGWSPAQVIVLYGLVFTSFGLADLTASSAGTITTYVKRGTFDRILLRPTPSLMQLLALEFELRRVGKAIPPAVALAVALTRVTIDWTVRTGGFLALSIMCGTAIFASLFIATAAVTFWIIDSTQATNAATYGGSTAAQYPLHIYPAALRVVLGFAVPVAFAGYVPAIELLDAPNPLGLPGWVSLAIVPVAAASLLASLVLWRAGTDHYQGTGS